MNGMLLVALNFFFFSYVLAAPEQIGLTYGTSPSEIVVSWAFIGSTEDVDARCEYGTSKDNLNMISSAVGSSYSVNDYTSPALYKANLADLQSGNQEYFYRVGSESMGFSDIFSFKSHPGVNVDGVHFSVVGDIGQTENTVDTLTEMMASSEALDNVLSGGIINMGDLSYANGKQELWDDFGNMKQFVSTSLPMYSTVGNHEWIDDADHSFIAYTARTDNPPVNGKRELYYSFDIGLVHWVMVAGYCASMKSVHAQPCLAEGSDEQLWLINDLAAVNKTNTPWTFVVFHQPYVNSNLHHRIKKEGEPMQLAIEDILFEAEVDVVFSGHVHAYERSCPMYKYNCMGGAPIYITIGDGGNHEGLADNWMHPQPDWSLFRQASYGFGDLMVANATHTSWQWHQNGDLTPTFADEFWVVKKATYDSRMEKVTKHPKFVAGARGEWAAKENARRTEANA